MKSVVKKSDEWGLVVQDLADENLKVQSYDHTMMPLLGDVADKKVLDYGSGPGILASALQRMGADVQTFDIDPEMNKASARRIGADNVFWNIGDVPVNHYDIVICNLVLCINEEDEVRNIARNIRQELCEGGRAFIGFCNPKIHNVPESQLDFRPKPEREYSENHSYMKTKKEGMYQIVENHRPIEWYKKIYHEAGLRLVDTFYTPEYELKGSKIRDFIIFKLTRR